jgi:hypothetical protein
MGDFNIINLDTAVILATVEIQEKQAKKVKPMSDLRQDPLFLRVFISKVPMQLVKKEVRWDTAANAEGMEVVEIAVVAVEVLEVLEVLKKTVVAVKVLEGLGATVEVLEVLEEIVAAVTIVAAVRTARISSLNIDISTAIALRGSIKKC